MASNPSKRSIEPAADAMIDRVRDAGDEAVQATSDLAAAAKNRLRSATDAGGSLYAEASDRVGDALDDPSASLSKAAETGQRLAMHGRRSVGLRLREQPIEALMLSGAIGYLVGWAVSRR